MSTETGSLIGTGLGGIAGAFMGNPAAGAAIGGGLGGTIGGMFDDDDDELKDLRTPEQKAAIKFLSELGQTGSSGGLTLGEAFGGPLGHFTAADPEKFGLARLMQFATGGQNQDLAKARETFGSLADTAFDPSDPKSGFGAFSRQLARAQKESADVLDREAAITGSRFGTGIQRQKRELAERGADTRASELARLFQNTMSQRLAGAQGLAQLAGQESDLQQRELSNLFGFGSLERELSDLKARRGLQEFQRQRGEKLKRIDIAQVEASRNPYLGVSSIPSSNPFSDLTSALMGGIGQSIGKEGFPGTGGGTFGGSKTTSQQSAQQQQATGNLAALMSTLFTAGGGD